MKLGGGGVQKFTVVPMEESDAAGPAAASVAAQIAASLTWQLTSDHELVSL